MSDTDSDYEVYDESDSDNELVEAIEREGEVFDADMIVSDTDNDSASEIGDDDVIDSDDDLAETIIEDLEPMQGVQSEIVVPPREKYKTSHIINKIEITELISIRADQISQYNNPLVDTKGLDNPIDMAWREFNLRKTPLLLRRKVGERYDKKRNVVIEYVEVWNVNEMTRFDINIKKV